MSDNTPLTPPNPAVQQMGNAYVDWPSRSPKRKIPPWVILLSIGSILLALGLGVALGYTTAQKPQAGSTPQSCLDALDAADDGFNVAADGFSTVRDMMMAVLDNDMAAFDKANSALDQGTEDMGAVADRYKPAKAACRAGAS